MAYRKIHLFTVKVESHQPGISKCFLLRTRMENSAQAYLWLARGCPLGSMYVSIDPCFKNVNLTKCAKDIHAKMLLSVQEASFWDYCRDSNLSNIFRSIVTCLPHAHAHAFPYLLGFFFLCHGFSHLIHKNLKKKVNVHII